MRVVRVDHMVWGAEVRAQTLFLLPTSASNRTEREVSPTPALSNSAKLCKPFRYMECRRNKWNCEEVGGGGCFQKRKFQVACLDGDEIERKVRGIMVWS